VDSVQSEQTSGLAYISIGAGFAVDAELSSEWAELHADRGGGFFGAGRGGPGLIPADIGGEPHIPGPVSVL
jgi:hypothetical protein